MKRIHFIFSIGVTVLLSLGMPQELPAQTEQPTQTERPAQTGQIAEAPESPDVLLPTMVLEAEGGENLFFVPLPLFAEPRMELPSPLKEVEAPLTFPPDFLTVTIPLSEAGSIVRERTSLYTEGTLGVGTMATLEGGLSLFQRGEDSKVNLKFFHRSRDGYQFHEAGNGYFDRQDQMTGEGGWKISRQTEIGMEGNIEEREVGLQGISPSYSNLYRFFDGKGTLTHHFTDALQFSTEMGIGYANRLLTGTIPKDRSETLARSLLRLMYGGEKGFIALEGSISGGTYSELSEQMYWVGGGSLEGEWNPAPWGSLAGGMGFLWVDELEIPFHIDLRVKPQEELLFTLQGAYTVTTLPYGNLWREVGPVAQADTPLHSKIFSVGFRGEMKGLDRKTSVSLEGGWQKRYSALQLLPYDVGQEHYPWQKGSLTTYRVQIEGSYSLSPGILMTLKWMWLLGDRTLLEKQHTLEGSVRIGPENRPFGGTLSGSWVTGTGTALPIVTIGGYYRPRESVEISLTLEDILSPYSHDSRTFLEPFITPGFRVLLKTTVMF